MQKEILVHKFGGEIAGNQKYLRKCIEIIKNKNKRYSNIIVVSALGGVTSNLVEGSFYFSENGSEKEIDNHLDKLKKIHYEKLENLKESEIIREKINNGLCQLKKYFQGINLLEETSTKMVDKILVFGEKFSSEIFSGYFMEENIKVKTLSGSSIGIITNDRYGDADILWAHTKGRIRKKLKPLLEKGITPIITGFDGKTKKNEITTLGRGGSDTTACVIGRDLKVKEVNLYKTTKGVTTADPKIVENAMTVPFLNYSEAMAAGKIIHRKGIEHARKGKIPLIVRYLLDQKVKTVINGKGNKSKNIKMVTYEPNCYLIEVQDSKMAEEQGHQEIITGLIAENKVNLKLTRDSFNGLVFVSDGYAEKGDIKLLEENLKERYCGVKIVPNMAIIRVIGSLGFNHVESSQFNEIIHKYIHKKEMCIGSYPYTNACSLDGVAPGARLKEIIHELHNELIR